MSIFLKIIYEFGFNFYSRKILLCCLFGLLKVDGIKSFLYEFCDKEINKIIKMKKKKPFEYHWPFSLFFSRLVNNNARKRWCGFVWLRKSDLLPFWNSMAQFSVNIARKHRKRLKEFSSALYVFPLFQVLFHRTIKFVIFFSNPKLKFSFWREYFVTRNLKRVPKEC